jgi:hypothetical protein
MEPNARKRYQGLTNVFRFNWHYYAIAFFAAASLLVMHWITNYGLFLATAILTLVPVTLSLLTTWYVYDLSGMYRFSWIKQVHVAENAAIVNIHAGFDETSEALRAFFPHAKMKVFDFYNENDHTELSIKRARKAVPPFPGTKIIRTQHVPLMPHSSDLICCIFSVHEIRSREERVLFLQQLQNSLTIDGICVIVEHLRDFPNFIAYNIGFMHFYSRNEWKENFKAAGLVVSKKISYTPFVTIFILSRQ